MSKFWSWFIPFILIICLIIFMLITRVNNNTGTVTDEFKLEFSDYIDGVDEIGTIGDKKVYSIYGTNKLNGKDLSNYLSDEFIDKLTDKMEFVDSLNDGGTSVYKSSTLANEEFYVIQCRTVLGNNDIYILNNMAVGYCRK